MGRSYLIVCARNGFSVTLFRFLPSASIPARFI